jgi:hypothetical protein
VKGNTELLDALTKGMIESALMRTVHEFGKGFLVIRKYSTDRCRRPTS